MHLYKEAIAKNITWHLLYRFIKLGLAFFITAWVARYLGVENYGIYVYAVGLAEMVMLFWSQGLKEVVIREIKSSGLENSVVSVASFQLMMLGNIILYALLAAILFLFVDQQVIILLSLICGIGIIFRSFEAFELWFHADLNVKVTVRVQFLSQTIYMVLNVYLILAGAELSWFAITYAVQLMITGVGFLVLYVRYNKGQSFRVSRKVQKRILHYGSSLLFAKLTLSSSFLIDRFIIEYLADVEILGYYSASMKMVLTWIFISSSISLSFLPVLTEAKEESERSKIATGMFGWMCCAAILLMIPFYLFADELVFLVFGEQFATSVLSFKILIFALPFLFLNEGIKIWLLNHNKTKYYIISTGSITVSILLLNLLLIPRYGLSGAAMAFVFSWVLGTMGIFLFFKETRPLQRLVMQSFVYPFKRLFSN